MRPLPHLIALTLVLSAGLTTPGCSFVPKRPCTEAGESAREATSTFRGIKKCFQIKDPYGVWVNDGKYYEWYNSDKIALTGEYTMGKRTGHWIQFDEKGTKISTKWYVNGVEVPAP
jgi:hypothetical protein